MKLNLAFLLSLLLGAGSALAQSGQTINQLLPGAALQGTEQIPMYQAANPAVTTTPSAVAAYTVGVPRSGLNGWVNIKDPRFGATGNGRSDDTAAIQAAIDYAFAHSLPGVYCPLGNYKTTDSIWLDPPGNMRATTFTGTGYISGTTLTISSGSTSGLSASGGSHIYGPGVAPDTVILSGTGPTYMVNNSQTIGSSGSPIAMTGNNPSNPTQFSYSLSFFGDPGNNQNYPSCQIYPQFNNGHAIELGTGGGMDLGNIAVQGPSAGPNLQYRGAQPKNGVAIAMNGGNGGSSPARIHDVVLSDFYILIDTTTNGIDILNDNNVWERISGSNYYIGLRVKGGNTLINHAYDLRFALGTIGVYNVNGNPLNVEGGTFQAEGGAQNSYTMSGVSAISSIGRDPLNPLNGWFQFTATLSSPTVCNIDSTCPQSSGLDPTGFGYVGTPEIYSWWGLQTADFGVVPMTLATTCISGTTTQGGTQPCWNPTTKQAAFQLYTPWVLEEFGQTDLSTTTNLSAEIQAVTTVYADERVYTAIGSGITLNGPTTENEGACATIINATGGAFQASRVKDLFNLSNFFTFSEGSTPDKFCNRTMPLIQGSNIILDGGVFIPPAGGNSRQARAIIETTTEPSSIQGHGLSFINFNFRPVGGAGYGWGQTETITRIWETVARGLGVWDKDYSLPSIPGSVQGIPLYSDITSPFCGDEPCPWAVPNLSASLLPLVCPSGNIASCGTLSTFNAYMPVACRTVFRSVDWNTGAVTPPSTVGGGIFLRSASCPGYSWGQPINNATIQAYETSIGASLTTVSWRHLGQSPVLYLDATTLGLMFPDLGFILDSGDGNGPHKYVVTGVYEDLPDPSAPTVRTGYVTVIGADTASGTLLTGNANQSYVCTSSCTIGQAPFSWSTY